MLVRPSQPSIEYRGSAGSGRIGTELTARVPSFVPRFSLTFAAKCLYSEYRKLKESSFFILTFLISEYDAVEAGEMKMEIKVDVVSAFLFRQVLLKSPLRFECVWSVLYSKKFTNTH